MLETEIRLQFEEIIMKGNLEKIKIEKGPHYTLVNPKTNTVYVSNNKSNVISVIDGTSIVESISVERPRQIAINPEQNRIYVISGHATGKYHDEGGQIAVLDGTTNKIIDSIDILEGISGIAVNPITNQIFGSQSNLKTVFVIDGSTNKIIDNIELVKEETANEKKGFFKKLTSGEASADSHASKVYNNIEVNANTNQVYVANPLINQIFVIDGSSKTLKDKFEVPMPFDVHINPKNDLLYIIEREFFEYNEYTTHEYDTLYAINTNSKVVIGTSREKKRSWLDKAFREKDKGHNDLAVNLGTNKVYFTNSKKNEVIVKDENLNVLETIKMDKFSNPSIAVNPTTNKVYLTSTGMMKNWMMVVNG